jgi:DNA-binding LacI/PurR family transcriptional regulator
MTLKDKPTAIFTGGDEVAAGIVAEAKRNNVMVPEDLAVVGFDNQAITELVEPSITTVYQPIEEMARKAFQVMIEKVRSKRYRHKEIYEYDLELIIRESTVKQGVCV